eukprot:2063737-Pyramimonas_sp.AAC.2
MLFALADSPSGRLASWKRDSYMSLLSTTAESLQLSAHQLLRDDIFIATMSKSTSLLNFYEWLST